MIASALDRLFSTLDAPLRIKIHQEYFHSILFHDMVERHDIAHPRAVADLAQWLVDHAASLYSLNSVTGYLKSLGHKTPKAAVANYLEWFADAYFLFTVRLFDSSLTRSMANPKKIYCVDHALITSVSSGILRNSGHLLENLVFAALRRSCAEIFYYKTKSGREVDFILATSGHERQLIQVCERLSDPRTRRRELDALEEAMREQRLKTGTIVTREESARIKVDGGTVEVVPVWRFLLLPASSG